jgi:general secretion pathway protein L
MSTLIVTLPAAPASATTSVPYVVSTEGRSITRQAEAVVSLLPPAAGAELVAVIPTEHIAWHRLELPRGTLEKGVFQEGSAQRLRTVLEGLLEDRVLDEPALLHFAVDPQARAGQPVWVAACNRAWLHEWLGALEQSGRTVSRIIPEMAPPSGDDAGPAVLYAWGSPDAAHLAYAGTQGVCTFPLTAASVAWINTLPGANGAAIFAEPGVASAAEQLLGRPVTLQTAAQRHVAASLSAWDMAQFDLLRTRGARTRKRLYAAIQTGLHSPQWRAARWAAGALLAINLVGLQIGAWNEQAQLNAKRAAVRNILTTTFPDIRLVVDAPLQMERAVADLQRQSGTASQADLETLLQKSQLSTPPTPTPTAIEFSAGQLRLQNEAGETQLFEPDRRP